MAIHSLYIFLAIVISAFQVSAREGLHLAAHGLLQVSPSFSTDGISLYPAHRPGHNAADIAHLTPTRSNELYYSQEGHRPSLHGAKHGSLEAEFNAPTVILDHTSHLKSIKCGSKHITASFSDVIAYEHVLRTWDLPTFHLVTYHLGCGDEYEGVRSFYKVTKPTFNPLSMSVTLNAKLIEKEQAMDSGVVEWGTYTDPLHRARVPVKGHVRLSEPEDYWRPKGLAKRQEDALSPEGIKFGNHTFHDFEEGDPVNLNNNATALEDFFFMDDFDVSDPNAEVPDDDVPEFIATNGTVRKETNSTTKRNIRSNRRNQLNYRAIRKRGIIEWFKGLFRGIVKFFQDIADFFQKAVEVIAKVANVVIQIAIVSAKLLAAAFGVPFDHSYHNDFVFNQYLKGEGNNKAPAIFGEDNGFILTKGDENGISYTVQCVKCGIQGDFTVDGRLAFSIKDGVTEGRISLNNNKKFALDAIFGITAEISKDKSIEGFKKQLAAVPLTPLAIPGIIVLGPQIAIGTELELSLKGKADLLIGGSLTIDTGVAALDVKKRENNKLTGFEVNFEPHLKFTGTITATAEFGLPISLEVGIDLLNGKFKKSVGLVEKPSVYAQAEVSNDAEASCPNGAGLSIGVKNRIFVQAFDLWNYDIRDDTLYEKQIACVKIDGFKSADVKNNTAAIDNVVAKSGKDNGGKVANLTDVAGDLVKHQQVETQKTGFRLIMDEAKESILVAGKDGHLYLVSTDLKYDQSAPWGTIDMKSQGVDVDVFGRVMSYSAGWAGPIVSEVRLWNPGHVPEGHLAGALTSLKIDGKDSGTYGVFKKDQYKMFYPTFCPTKNGFAMFATRLPFDKDGKVVNPDNDRAAGFLQQIMDSVSKRATKQPNGCRTVRLTSILNDQK